MMTKLTKIHKSLLNKLKKLNIKKYRDLEQKFIIEGKRIVSEALNSDWKIEYLLIRENTGTDLQIKKLIEIADKKGIPNYLVKTKDFENLCDTITSQGIIAIIKKKSTELNQTFNKNIQYSLIVALEKISDPGNLGTILRICDWFAVDAVLVSKESADLYNPKVLRASMGSIFHLNVVNNVELNKVIEDFRKNGYKIYSTTLDGINLEKIKFHNKAIIIFGSEADGISGELIKVSDEKITIPRYGKAESLNVASACAIILSDYKSRTKELGLK